MNLKEEVSQITKEYYPHIQLEKQMDTMQESRQGARETNIERLLEGATFSELLDRVANFASPKQILEIANYLKKFIVDNNLVDDEELI